MRLADKIVMLTGGGRGIGRTICLTMAREGNAWRIVAERTL